MPSAASRADAAPGMYLFWGEEDYLKNHRAAQLRDEITGSDPDLAAFNVFELAFGPGELDLARLKDALLAPPMMAPVKFISVSLPELDALKEAEKEALLSLLSEFSGAEDCVLVLRVGGFDPGTEKRPAPFLVQARRFMTCVEFPYQTPAKLTRWLERHCAAFGVRLPSESAALLLSLCGRSMYRLTGEIEKAAAYSAAHGHDAVTPEDLSACVSRTEEDDAFRLANCLLAGDTAEALRCFRLRVRRKEEPVLLLSQVTRVFCDLSAAAAFASEGLEQAEYASAMKVNGYKASLYWRAARLHSPEAFAAVMNASVEADCSVKLGGGVGAVEQLILTAAAIFAAEESAGAKAADSASDRAGEDAP